MSGTLSGQVLVMTGGGMGFGECMAKAVAREGVSVVIADVNLPEAQRVAEAINADGENAEYLPGVRLSHITATTDFARAVNGAAAVLVAR